MGTQNVRADSLVGDIYLHKESAIFEVQNVMSCSFLDWIVS